MAVRQGQENHVMGFQDAKIGGLDHALGQRSQMRMVLTERAAGACRRCHRADRQAAVRVTGMPEQ